MRFEGRLEGWDDQRGFGFIQPSQGGEPVFVHIKAIRGLRERPRNGLHLQFEVRVGEGGKKRAVNAQPVPATSPLPRRGAPPLARERRGAPARLASRWGVATWGAWVFLPVMLTLGYSLGQPPQWLLWLYPLASLLTFGVYAADKAAAQRGAWRTAESTLHGLALIGGWPGALLAQQLLRHKSVKAEFRAVFWLTVALNVAAFAYLASPAGQRWLMP